MGVPINGGPLYGGPTINGRSVDPNLDPQRGNSGCSGVIPKEIHTLNDAILAAGKSLSTRPQGSRRIVYVISDGKESRSKANFREVVKLSGEQPGRRLRHPGRRFGHLGSGLPGQDQTAAAAALSG